MADVTHIFGGAFRPPVARPVMDQIRDAMASAGISPPAMIQMDGKLHRFQTASKGKPGYDKPGWYVFHGDGVPAGMFGDWRSGVTQLWRADVGRPLTVEEELAVTRRQAEARAARDALANQVADTVEAIWMQAGAASDDHPYLARKGVGAHGLRITGDGRLIAPLYSPDGKLSSLQYIDADGGKLYHASGVTRGCMWSVGVFDSADVIYIAEGFATAATIHEVTKRPCIVSYSASNLVPVTEAIRRDYPAARLVIVADNDASGVGQRYAEQAAARYGASVIVIPVPGDANDYRAAGMDLDALLNPLIDGWLIPADDFAAQPAPIEWLVKGWLQAHALMMVHGPSGGGKTFAVLDWALHLAAGREEWNGVKVRPGPVVYLAGEGHHGLRGRVAAWKQHHKADRLQMWLSREGCDLNTSEGRHRVIEHIRALPVTPRLVIVDTLHRFLAGDENKATDTKSMLDACAAVMREFGCSVLLVHHTGVSDEAQHRARGSSAWRGALDIEISIVPGKAGALEIVQRKSKDAELLQPLAACLTGVEIAGWVDEDGAPVRSAVLEVTGAAEAEKPGGKIAEYQKAFQKAYEHGGRQRLDGAPYVTREQLRQTLTGFGWPAGTVRNNLNVNQGKLIGSLVLAEFIAPAGDGWVIIEPGWVAVINVTE